MKLRATSLLIALFVSSTNSAYALQLCNGSGIEKLSKEGTMENDPCRQMSSQCTINNNEAWAWMIPNNVIAGFSGIPVNTSGARIDEDLISFIDSSKGLVKYVPDLKLCEPKTNLVVMGYDRTNGNNACSFRVGHIDSGWEHHRAISSNTSKSSLPSEGQKAVLKDGCIARIHRAGQPTANFIPAEPLTAA